MYCVSCLLPNVYTLSLSPLLLGAGQFVERVESIHLTAKNMFCRTVTKCLKLRNFNKQKLLYFAKLSRSSIFTEQLYYHFITNNISNITKCIQQFISLIPREGKKLKVMEFDIKILPSVQASLKYSK